MIQDALRSGGRPLVSDTLTEPRFGHDFARVKVHTGTESARSATARGPLLLQRQPAKKADPAPIAIDSVAIFFQVDSIEFRHDAKADSMVRFLDALAQVQQHLKNIGRQHATWCMDSPAPMENSRTI